MRDGKDDGRKRENKMKEKKRLLTDLILEILDLETGFGLLVLDGRELDEKLGLLGLDLLELLILDAGVGLRLGVIGGHELENHGLLGLELLDLALEVADDGEDDEDGQEDQDDVGEVGHDEVGVVEAVVEAVVERSGVVGHVAVAELGLELSWMMR